MRSTMRPVTTAASTPANWPARFSALARRPAAPGSASVVPMEKIIGVERPKKAPAHRAARQLHAIVTAAPRALVSTNVLRTLVAEAP